MSGDPGAEPGLPVEWYQAELRACQARIRTLEAELNRAEAWAMHLWGLRDPAKVAESIVGAPTPTMHFHGVADQRPHSRACDIRHHEHGPDCTANCPTCHGH